MPNVSNSLEFITKSFFGVVNQLHYSPFFFTSLPIMTKASSDFDYDFLVIGGGSGGIASAKRAASHGAKVAGKHLMLIY